MTERSSKPFAESTGVTTSGESSRWFSRFANAVGRLSAQPSAFLIAFGLVLAWATAGPFFGFSTAWQLTINTSSTIITFLMVFLIQYTQYRDTLALQLKLSELIFVVEGAEKRLAIAEHFSDEEMQRLREVHQARAEDHNLNDTP
jgi:low affinity Fe/Cu permease